MTTQPIMTFAKYLDLASLVKRGAATNMQYAIYCAAAKDIKSIAPRQG